MKFLKSCSCNNHTRPQIIINQLVILLVCITRTVQSHAIAEAGEILSVQNFQKLYPNKALASASQPEASNTWPHTQLEVPPVGATANAEQQVVARSPPSQFASFVAETSETENKTLISVATPKNIVPSPHTKTPLLRPSQSSSANTTPPPPPLRSSGDAVDLLSRNRWIESILINVEVMNLVNERRREQLVNESSRNTSSEQDAPEERSLQARIPAAAADDDQLPASQAPTDSGEDLLDSQLELTTVAASVGVSELISSEEQKLVESNNVSATLQQQTAALSPAQIITAAPSKQVLSCEQAYTQCALREVCAPTLKAYNDDCQALVNNQTSECSSKCLRAMIALKSSEAGEDLANCDCQGNEFCVKSKARSQACQPQVDQALEPERVVSCSVASAICMANQLCSTALGYYYSRCQSLFSLRHCSSRCNNSLTILYKQPQAMKLINCQCDGSEEFPCVMYKTYTEQLCLNKQTNTPFLAAPSTPTSGGVGAGDGQTDAAAAASSSASTSSFFEHFGFGNFDGAGDDFETNDEQQSQATNEDDGFNLTSDPTDTSLVIHGGGGARESDDYGGSPSDADVQNANNYFFNGIQAQQPSIEDNWIPLVSGRYFTNLHQQQQRLQQQQQQQRQQKVKQQQQQRKPTSKRTQKNARQKVRSSNETRRRHSINRPYMFALTSSATGVGVSQASDFFKASLSALLSVILFTFL